MERPEAINKGLVRYATGRACSKGHVADRFTSTRQCVECVAGYNSVGQEKRTASASRWRAANPEKAKESSRKSVAKWRAANPEKAKQLQQLADVKRHSDRLERNALRRANEKQASLGKAHQLELRKIYRGCPVGHHVDHVVPLNHPKVCGLHVPWNLQYLLEADNLKKGNHFE